MQHCLLQQHFNIAFGAPSSATLLLLLNDDRFRVFDGAEVGSWGLKCLGSKIDFFYG